MAVAEAADVVLTSEQLSISSWPHALIDCPAAWSSPSSSPCPSCFCFVCDTPFPSCDDPAAHAAADGAQEHWRRIKRRRAALINAWHDIPALVNIIVQLSVDEAARNVSPKHDAHLDNPCGSPTCVGMTAGYPAENAFLAQKDTDSLAEDLAAVSLASEAPINKIIKAEQDTNLFTSPDFVKNELVGHVNHELLSHTVVKSEIVGHTVQPGPE